MAFPFIIVAIVINYLRKSLKTKETIPALDKKILLAMYVSIGLFIAAVIVSSLVVVFDIIGFAMLGALLYLINKEEKLKPFKFLVVALLPYLIVIVLSELIKLISSEFYQKQQNIINSVNTCAVLWGIGVWLVTKKQQKELTKAREKALEEEENNKFITAVNERLEVEVAERTAELTQQKEELELTVKELKSTQAQLIQSEKMASLGELTAGIAHEIQNPLNFINNFSEVNNELIEELKTEKAKAGNEKEENLEKELLNDIVQNNEKIAFHGRRADAIVKGMLQHSRKNTGQKELTDINALCDEYLRLSYHGLRAKDKSFNADFKTEFDESLSAGKTAIGKINIVPQDIGRVILNLINNAFYAVSEKRKDLEGLNSYKPLVLVQTKKVSSPSGIGGIEIKVIDNGNGIPQNIIDKIFQPFFTTKPTGQGTGLGLSLAYDIITKEHNGTIKVNSRGGEGSEFIVTLPV